jgi:hypothetical protein
LRIAATAACRSTNLRPVLRGELRCSGTQSCDIVEIEHRAVNAINRMGIVMRNIAFAAVAVTVAAAASLSPALADGPRASSGNNWTGMMESTAPAQPVQVVQPQVVQPVQVSQPGQVMQPAAPASGVQPHYVLEQGYVHGGKWESRWVLVQ